MRRCLHAVPFVCAALMLPGFAQSPEAVNPPAPEPISFPQRLERLAADRLPKDSRTPIRRSGHQRNVRQLADVISRVADHLHGEP